MYRLSISLASSHQKIIITIKLMSIFFLPSKERKTLGRGCGRLETPVQRKERARKENAMADTRGGLANPSGLPITAPLRNQSQSPLLLERGFGEKIVNSENTFPHTSSCATTGIVTKMAYVPQKYLRYVSNDVLVQYRVSIFFTYYFM